MKTIGLILLAALLAGCAAPRLYFEHPLYTFGGTLASEDYYGPPNYAESPATDSRETAFILALDKPISVRPHAGDDLNTATLANVERVQLVGVLRGALASSVGHRITVRGSLSQATSAHHRTEVVLTAESITSETGEAIPFRLED